MELTFFFGTVPTMHHASLSLTPLFEKLVPKNRLSKRRINKTREMWDKKKDSMRFYNTIFTSYDELYAKEQETKYNIILKSMKKTSFGTILDVGCGSGLFLQKIANVSKIRVGVDISHKMLSNAKKNNTSSTYLICADADYLPFKKKIFDSVFTFTFLQNMPDPKSTLHEIGRVGKHKSIFGITFHNNSNVIQKALDWLKDIGISYQEIADDTALKDHFFILER